MKWLGDVRTRVILIGGLFLAALCASMMGLASRQAQMLRQQQYREALALFDLIVLTRSWNARYGGVFVEKGPGVLSNPYLAHPDLHGATGKVYTMRSPAEMTREISELALANKGFSFHITSLHLLNRANRADAWETDALKSFQSGVRERTGVTTVDDVPFYRLMRPLYVERSCLTCHTTEGYRVGDVRGGISVSLPASPTQDAITMNTVSMLFLTGVLVVAFIVVMYGFVLRLLTRLSRQTAELLETNKAKDRFLGMVAHDLRTPLTVTSGVALALMAEVKEEEHLALLRLIGSSSKRMITLIDGLLDVAQVKSGTLELHLCETNIADMVVDAVACTRLIAATKAILVRADVAADIGTVRADPVRLRQILDNLLGNAVKYSPAQTTITVGARRESGRFEIWVQDQGLGIEKAELSTVFNEFAMGSARPTAGESSHGLGLAIVKRLVDLHQGTIRIDSELGKGTRLTVSIPCSSS
ncbi:MAG: ATP-binding protein [Elusimicrobiota bacterium]